MGKLEDVLKNRFAEYESFAQKGANSSAFTRLAEILNVVLNSELSKRMHYDFLKRVEDAAKAIGKDAVHGDYEAKLLRLKKITSVGTDFNDDEVLLLLTLRVQLQVAAELYDHLGWESLGLSNPDIDVTIKRIMRTNEESSQTALALARKNWGLPLVTDWL
jgi:hypothetical protein